jgi:hypothetical protein
VYDPKLAPRPRAFDYGGVCDPQARLFELRVRFRRNREARVLIDRCLMLVARASAADADMAALDRDVTKIADDLALRFGAPRRATVQ